MEPRVWSPRDAAGRIRWTWYTVSDWMACRRRFKLAVVDDLVPLMRSPALSTGSAFHYGMEAGFREVEAAQAASTPADLGRVAEVATAAVDAYPYVGEDGRETARRLAAYYWAEAAQRDVAEWKILGVEQKLRGRLGGHAGLWWEATVDLLVEVGPPAHTVWHGLWVVNWKSASDLREGTFGWAKREGQFLGEQAAARAQGLPVRGLILAVVTKGKHPTYTRDYVEWPSEKIDEFQEDILAHARTARLAIGRRGPWPQSHTACASRWGPCPYWDLCEDGPRAAGLFGTREEAAKIQGGDPLVTLEEPW